MAEQQPQQARLTLDIGFDESKIPASISLSGTDLPSPIAAKAVLLSVFDEQQRDTLRIDLWTKNFQVAEMDRLVYNTLRGLSETYRKATKNEQLADQFGQFVRHFGEVTEILPPRK